MILPHDADKGKLPKDAKAFGFFVVLVIVIVGVVIYNM